MTNVSSDSGSARIFSITSATDSSLLMEILFIPHLSEIRRFATAERIVSFSYLIVFLMKTWFL
jgi:hypothetical protein